MNILLIHQNFVEENDGGGSRFNEMTRLWEDQGHRVTVMAGMVNHATGEKLPRYQGKYVYLDQLSENRKVYRTHVSGGYGKSFFGRLLGYFSFVFSSTYAGLFKAREKYDVILSTSPPLFVGISAYILSVFKRTPIVFEVRDLWPESAIDTGVLNNKTAIKMAFWFERFIYRKAKLVNALTPAFEQKMLEQKGLPREKVIMIPNAADFSISDEIVGSLDRDAFRKEQGWEGRVVIIYVGAHGLANNLIQVVQTAELLKDEHPEVLFALVGDGMEKNMLKEETAKRGLTNVQFIDSVPKREVFKYIYAADLGTSVLKRVDTFKTVYSNKTFDYMACKRPILMVIDGVSRQLVEDAQCGIYVEPEQPSDFAAKIKDYLALDRSEWKAQGERGFAYAKANFDRTVLAERYIEHIRTILKKPETTARTATSKS
ncbi:MAG: glycosyltransferase family 4 protein [Phaeodactylibacter sp.]|nr:glycosyltransferase family 4 protein [Phaeodactylibacter sp.]